MVRAWTALGVVAAAALLTVIFWTPLWEGGGFIGGDTYPYYFPQKAAYAVSLARGELPLWNSLVSLGYPQLAESQTGALYPPNLILYRVLDVNTAYNASHLLHYFAAYLLMWLAMRRMGLRAAGSHLAALVFVYGWFPPRACLEWAILTGTYFPLLLWSCESYLATSHRRWLLVFTMGLTLLLLAGHFNLAFIALLTAAIYLPARIFWARAGVHPQLTSNSVRSLGLPLAAVVLGFLLAAVQLVPTLELKLLSQRNEAYSNQTYGYIPSWYLTQALWPTLWWGPDVNADGALWTTNWGAPPAPPGNTNKIEAHLYFGVVPFYLLLLSAFFAAANGYRPTRFGWLWIAFAFGAVAMATGWPIVWLRNIPGFGFFAGPGRYGIVTAFAVALGAGFFLDAILRRTRMRPLRTLIFAAVTALTVFDFWNVSRWVTNVVMVSQPPVSFREESTLRTMLKDQPAPVRIWAPGPNLPTLTGLNCVPEYLGIGPSAYYDPKLAMPKLPDSPAASDIAGMVDWLQRAGVTHILRFEPLNSAAWPVDAGVSLLDPFLNAAWGRGREPLYLYQLRGSRPRAFLEGASEPDAVTFVRSEPGVVELDVQAQVASKLVLLDLHYPGWIARIDGQAAPSSAYETMYRSVEVPSGSHRVTWTYSPNSFRYGAGISAVVMVLLGGGTALWLRQRKRSQQATTT